MRFSLALLSVCTALLALAWTAVPAGAEQIRLADGRFLQGDVVEVKDDGFTFKLTDSGGKVFLRWNQVDAGLKERLKNEKDPDAGLNLDITVEGARLEMIDGTVHQGKITRAGSMYVISNRERRSAQVPVEDVLDDGYVTGIEIDATIMMSEREALALAEEQRSPLDTALKYYEMARIADRLGLYEEARDYVTNAQATSPDARLQARLTEYETRVADLIRQKELLVALGAARQLAKKNKYQLALDVLKEAKETHKPTEGVLAKWQEVNDEVELDFTKYVIEEWYKLVKTVAQAKFKEKESRTMTAGDALSWGRREMDLKIQERLAANVGSEDTGNIKQRFMLRHKLAEAKLIRLFTRKATFGEEGFYQNVGGHLPVAGVQPRQQNPQPVPGSGPGRRGGNRDGSRNDYPGNQAPSDWENEGQGFQDEPKPPSAEDIRDAIRRIMGGEEEKKEDSSSGSPVKRDVSKLKVPTVVPSLNDWWDKAPTSIRARWVTAVYVKFGGTMQILELDNWDVKYR